MKIVIITGDKPEHHYVTNTLTKQLSVDAVLVCEPPARRSWKSALKRSPLTFLDKVARTVFLWLVSDAKARKDTLQYAFGESGERFLDSNLVQFVGRPKDGKLANVVASLSPDILAIYGTGKIPDSVIMKAKITALNMHTGISPYYRGVSCSYWPILDKAPEMVGATVHECTSIIDGGEIYLRRRACLRGDETIHGIFAKAVIAGSEAYTQVIQQALDGKLVGEAQDLSIGKEYTGKMIGINSELKIRKALQDLRRSNKLMSSGGVFDEE